jgi:hypothetical protein
VGRTAVRVLFVVAMVAVIVGVDVLFFRGDHFWERLAANVGIVLVFAAFYFRFLR